jgi:hypothetical protein
MCSSLCRSSLVSVARRDWDYRLPHCRRFRGLPLSSRGQPLTYYPPAVILQLRLYALYLHNKKVLAFMVICFLTSSACAAVIMGTVMSRVTGDTETSHSCSSMLISRPAVSQLIPGMHFCIPLGVSPDFYIFWLPIIAFETLLGVLALVRGVQTVRSDHGLMRVGRDLINILIRDSVLYFLMYVPLPPHSVLSCIPSNRIAFSPHI